jgi:hypothetical protein
MKVAVFTLPYDRPIAKLDRSNYLVDRYRFKGGKKEIENCNKFA